MAAIQVPTHIELVSTVPARVAQPRRLGIGLEHPRRVGERLGLSARLMTRERGKSRVTSSEIPPREPMTSRPSAAGNCNSP
jgi:hypothetical protein